MEPETQLRVECRRFSKFANFLNRQSNIREPFGIKKSSWSIVYRFYENFNFRAKAFKGASTRTRRDDFSSALSYPGSAIIKATGN